MTDSGCLPCSLSRTSGKLFPAPVFVVGSQVSLHVLPQQIVRRRKTDLRRSAPADANLLLFPHPVFDLRDLYRRDVYGGDPAAPRPIGGPPGLPAPLHPPLENVVPPLPVPLFRLLH